MIKKHPAYIGRYASINRWYGWRMFLLRFIQGPAKVIDGIVQMLTLGIVETELSIRISDLKLREMFAEHKRRKGQ